MRRIRSSRILANTAINTGPCKTARCGRIASHYEFASHTPIPANRPLPTNRLAWKRLEERLGARHTGIIGRVVLHRVERVELSSQRAITGT